MGKVRKGFDFARTSRDSTSPLSHLRSLRQFSSFPDIPRQSPKMAEALFPKPMQLDRAGLSPVE